MAKEHVIIKSISKVYPDGTKALHDINLVIEEGEIVVLLGSSGCGKSTLLRIIGGLEKRLPGRFSSMTEKFPECLWKKEI